MPKEGWKSVSIPEELVEKAKKLIESGVLEGYHTPSEVIIDAFRRRLEEIERIQLVAEEYSLSEEEVKRMANLEHINIARNSGRTIIAVRDHTDKRVYDVYVSKDARGRAKIFCDGDKAFDCVHVKYVYFIILPKLEEYIEQYKRK